MKLHKKVIISPHHSIEVGASTWNPKEISVRSRYDSPKTGRFSPHGSSEIPLEDMKPVMTAVAENDLLTPKVLAEIIEILAKSIARQS